MTRAVQPDGMTQRHRCWIFDGYCHDWVVEIDPEKRDPLIGRAPDKYPGDPYHEWRRTLEGMGLALEQKRE